jgi:hypothetical protein
MGLSSEASRRLMTVLPLYAYCRGIYSSRRITKPCREAGGFPDHRRVRCRFHTASHTAAVDAVAQVIMGAGRDTE